LVSSLPNALIENMSRMARSKVSKAKLVVVLFEILVCVIVFSILMYVYLNYSLPFYIFLIFFVAFQKTSFMLKSCLAAQESITQLSRLRQVSKTLIHFPPFLPPVVPPP